MAAASLVHVAFVARGDHECTLHGTLYAIANLARTSVQPERLRYHLLASGSCLRAASTSSRLGASFSAAGVVGIYWNRTLLPRINLIDASDQRLKRLLSPDVAAWLTDPRLPSKTRTYLIPKLALYEILPAAVPQVVVLDADLLPMADVAELDAMAADAFRQHPSALMAYAPEQQVKDAEYMPSITTALRFYPNAADAPAARTNFTERLPRNRLVSEPSHSARAQPRLQRWCGRALPGAAASAVECLPSAAPPDARILCFAR